MISSLQPSRPKVATPQSQNPLHQQQTRPSSTESSAAPRNQLEAMPPHQIPLDSRTPGSTAQPFNPAMIHPVFFSGAWRKAPFPLPGPAGFSPVATGYVFGAGTARKEPLTKL
ncbi:hypothetical protein WHR41_03913 [Cladosporium halotolerans]|uniref:Uncharacterized protein n=1 Tax=Cladosporium halotolerans TaxID=1052096 RepID=A0AB34KUB4_9PEZI